MNELISDRTEQADRAWLCAIAEKRDEHAFDALTAVYRESLRRFLVTQTGDAAAAEDLLQETLLRVWTRAELFDGRGPVKAWLFRIAGNLASNHRRTVGRRREASLVPVNADWDEEDGAFWPEGLIESAALGPDAVLLRAAENERVAQALSTLPGDARELLQLAYGDEQSVREVAEAFGIPEGTVKSRLFHARKRLARVWSAQSTETDEPR